MRVYFDLCALQRPLDDQLQLRVRTETEAMLSLLDLCQEGKVELIASGAHVLENEKSPHPKRREHVESVLGLSVEVAQATPSVLTRAEGLGRRGIKRLDALHLASAVEASADYFCTTDDRLLKKGKAADTAGTSVVSPLELAVLLR